MNNPKTVGDTVSLQNDGFQWEKGKKKVKILISGGGTGGHVFPAIAIANTLKEIDDSIDIKFVGAKGKIEMEKVPKAGFPIEGLWISGFHRKLTAQNLLFPFKLIHSLWKANSILNQFKPDVVVGVGGYASGPTLEMATRKKIPCLIQEQNSFAGVTNRLLSNKVNLICVAYDKMDSVFPKEKLSLTGNPVRQDIWNYKGTRNEACKHFVFDNTKKIVLILGGSLGAKSLNIVMKESSELIKSNPNIQFLWQAGKLYIDEYRQYETAQLSNVTITDFIDRMDHAYKMADVVIGRAGALTISELCLVGKPTILVPSPNVAEDHQTHNAMALVEKEAAILVKDKDASSNMIQTALDVLKDEKKQVELSKNILTLAKPNAAKEIAQKVLSLVNVSAG